MKKLSIIASSILIVFLLATSAAAAAEPVFLLDFSKEPANAGQSGRGLYEFVKDNGVTVLHYVCVLGIDLGDNGDGYVTYNVGPFDGDKNQWMKIRLKNPTDYTKFELHFAGGKAGVTTASKTHFEISAKDTEYKEYIVNIPKANEATFYVYPDRVQPGDTSWWTGNITQVRFDFMYDSEPGGQILSGKDMYVEYVAFFATEADAIAFRQTSATPGAVTTAPVTTAVPATTAPSTTQKPAGDISPVTGDLALTVIVAAAAACIICMILASRKRIYK